MYGRSNDVGKVIYNQGTCNVTVSQAGHPHESHGVLPRSTYLVPPKRKIEPGLCKQGTGANQITIIWKLPRERVQEQNPLIIHGHLGRVT